MVWILRVRNQRVSGLGLEMTRTTSSTLPPLPFRPTLPLPKGPQTAPRSDQSGDYKRKMCLKKRLHPISPAVSLYHGHACYVAEL